MVPTAEATNGGQAVLVAELSGQRPDQEPSLNNLLGPARTPDQLLGDARVFADQIG